MAGLPVVQLMHDASALALAYAKTKAEDLAKTDETQPCYLVFADCGSASIQATMVAVSKEKAVVLASSSSTNTGGKLFGAALVEHLVQLIEDK